MVAILDYWKTNLAIFHPQVTLILPTKFQVNWPFSSEDMFKIDFQDGCFLEYHSIWEL